MYQPTAHSAPHSRRAHRIDRPVPFTAHNIQAALPHVDVVPHYSLKYQYRNGSADLSFEAARDFCAAAAEAGARYVCGCGRWVADAGC